MQIRVQLNDDNDNQQVSLENNGNTVDEVVKEGCTAISGICQHIREEITSKTKAFTEEENRSFRE